METTTYLGLKKPAQEDYYNVEDWNTNSDLLDQYAAGLSGDGGVLAQMQSAIAALAGGVRLKGAVDHYTDLPSSGQHEGDAYTVLYAGTSGTDPLGVEYAWATYNSTPQWIPLGVDPSYFAKASDLTAEATARQAADAKQDTAIKDCLNGKCKNLLDVFSSQSAAGASSVTINGCTWTINADGTVTADSGGATLTSSSSFYIFGSSAAFATTEETWLSGCPSGGAENSKWNIVARIGDSYYRDTGSGIAVPEAPLIRQCALQVYSGQVANHTFRPMLTPKRVHDIAPEFVGYYPDLPALWQAVRALQ